MSASPLDLLDVSPRRAIDLLESDLDLTARDLASALGVDLRTIDRWRSGTSYPQHEARRRLAALLAVHRHLRETFTTTEAIHEWMRYPHPYLGRITPLEMVRIGRFDRVEHALEALDSGIFI